MVPEETLVSDEPTVKATAFAASTSPSSANTVRSMSHRIRWLLGLPITGVEREGGCVNRDGEDSDGGGSDVGENICVTPSLARTPLVKQARFRRSSNIPETASARVYQEAA